MVAVKGTSDASVLPAAHRWLQKLARHMLLDPRDSDDLVQETLAELCLRPRTMQDWRTYLAAVLRNKARMHHRGNVRRLRRESEEGIFAATDLRPSDERLDHARLAARLVAEIDALSEPFRTTLRLRYYEDLEPSEIARQLGVPAPTVRKRHQLAIQRLRERLDQSGDRELWRASFALLLKLPTRPLLDVGALRLAPRWFAGLATGALVVACLLPTMATLRSATTRDLWAQAVPKTRERDGLAANRNTKPLRSSSAMSAQPPSLAHVASGETARFTTVSDQAGPRTASAASFRASGTPDTECASLQRLIDEAAAYAVVHVPACVYRESLVIKRPITLKAEPGAQVRGSDVWRVFVAKGQLWRSERQVAPPGTDMRCGPQQPCKPDVFVDGEPQRLVATPPAPGQFMIAEAGEIWLGASPEDHTVEVVTRPVWIDVAANDVSINGFAFAHALHPEHSLRVPSGVRRVNIENNRLSFGAGVGVRLGGQAIRFENNVLEHFGHVALLVDGGEDVVIAGNHITHAGQHATQKLATWAWGGVGAVHGRNLRIERNQISGNRGHGVWLIGTQRASIENNRISGNWGSGITLQAARHVTAAGNTLLRNGVFAFPTQPALFVAESQHVDIRGNTLAAHAINFIATPLNDGPHQDPCAGASHLRMKDNTFTLLMSFASSFQAAWSCGSLRMLDNQIYTLNSWAGTEPKTTVRYTRLTSAAWRAHLASL